MRTEIPIGPVQRVEPLLIREPNREPRRTAARPTLRKKGPLAIVPKARRLRIVRTIPSLAIGAPTKGVMQIPPALRIRDDETAMPITELVTSFHAALVLTPRRLSGRIGDAD